MMTALKALAARNASAIGAGHIFVVVMRDGFPINVLGRIKDVPEVCSIYCATANPVEVDRGRNRTGPRHSGRRGRFPAQGRRAASRTPPSRHDFLRKIGYKR